MSEDRPQLRVLRRTVAAPGRGNTVLVVAASLLALVAGAVFVASLLADTSVTLQGSALAVATLALAFAVRRSFAYTYPQVLAAEERKIPRPREGSLAAVQPLPRRSFLVRVVAGAAGLFGLSLLAPVSSLGTPREGVQAGTSWSAGTRLVDEHGEPLQAADIVAVALAWPEGLPKRELDSVIVVRVADPGPEDPTNLDWVVDGGLVAYSKICTHAGCPVALYQEERGQLFCPCHQASFDTARAAEPTFGPAARRLPQLPMGVDGDGVLVALGDFDEPVGPHVGSRGGPA